MAFRSKVDYKNKKSTRFYSYNQEKKVAETLGGEQTLNSGATPFQKGDVLINGESSWLIECKTKTTSSSSINIKKDWFKKNLEEACMMGKKYTAVSFNFGPDEPNYYIINEWLFKDLIDYLKNKKN